MSELYLVHHGIKDMHWGDRRAEWYPIADYQAHLRNQGFSKSEIKKKMKIAKKGEKEYQKIDSHRKKYQSRANTYIDKRYDKKLNKLNNKNATDAEKLANEILRELEHAKVSDISIDDYDKFERLIKQSVFWEAVIGPGGAIIPLLQKDNKEIIKKMEYRISNKDAKKMVKIENINQEVSSKNQNEKRSRKYSSIYNDNFRQYIEKEIKDDWGKVGDPEYMELTAMEYEELTGKNPYK